VAESFNEDEIVNALADLKTINRLENVSLLDLQLLNAGMHLELTLNQDSYPLFSREQEKVFLLPALDKRRAGITTLTFSGLDQFTSV